MRETIGLRIRELREAQKLSLAELARRINSQRQSVHAWELGHAKPTDETMLAVSRALGTSISYLYGETDYPGPPLDWQKHPSNPSLAHSKAREAGEALDLARRLLAEVADACAPE